MCILIVDNRSRQDTGSVKSSMTEKLIVYLASHFPITVIDCVEDALGISYTNVSLVVLSGSSLRMTIPDNLSSCRMGMVVVTQARAHNIPIFGICFGMQLLAWMFGGTVGTLDSNKPYTQNNMYFNHNDAVFVLPPGFTGDITSHTNNYYQSMRHQVHDIEAVQFHPEGSDEGLAFLFHRICDLIRK